MVKTEQHQIEWTPERIERFWDYYSDNKSLEGTYFASMSGQQLIDYVRKRIRIGVAVDIGCGRGDLIGFLLNRRIRAYGMDQSNDSVELVRKRFSSNALFLGAGDQPPPADTAFMLEVVEHMDDEALGKALASIRRILKPGGHLIITTPNNEDLDKGKIMCPECGCIFHRMQHVRRWSADTLASYVERHGFEAITCAPYRLGCRVGLMGLLDKIRFRHEKPNLIYIGRVVGDHRTSRT